MIRLRVLSLFDQLSQAYYDQARGQLDGGADLILLKPSLIH